MDIPTRVSVVPYLCGGLGNVIWQSVAAWIVARETGTAVAMYAPVTAVHNPAHDWTDYRQVVARFVDELLRGDENAACAALLATGYAEHQERVDAVAWTPRDLPHPPLVMKGYFQSYPSIERYATEIRGMVRDGLRGPLAEALAAVQTSADDVAEYGFVHVRRGDYVHVAPLCTESYYRRALALVPPHARLWIFTDDYDWVSSQAVFQDSRLRRPPPLKAMQTLALMGACTRACVVANSTFSWWGAFIGATAAGSTVVAPAWQSSDRYPSAWTVLEDATT